MMVHHHHHHHLRMKSRFAVIKYLKILILTILTKIEGNKLWILSDMTNPIINEF